MALPVLAGAGAIAFSWQRWINPFLDSSREMIVPARLAAGERLYRDVVYHYGPAGPWVNALALEVFGRRFLVLEAVGLCLSVLLFFSLYRLTRRAGSPLSALVAVTFAAALCLGAPNGGAFLFPYSFDSLFALTGGFFCLWKASEPPSRRANLLAAAGLALALASKPEIGAAAAVLLVVAALFSEQRRPERSRSLTILGLGGAAALPAYAIAFAGLSWQLRSPEGPLALFAPPPEWVNVYRAVSGLDDPAGSFGRVLTALFLDLLILGGAALVALRRPRVGRPPAPLELGWFAAVAAATLFLLLPTGARIEDRLPPLLMPAPLAAAAAALLLLKRRLDAGSRARLLLFGFAAAMGSRVVLGLAYGATTTPYSIFALPGLAAASAVLVLDQIAPRLPHPAAFRRAAAAVFLALAAVGLLRLARFYPPEGVLTVHTAAGSLRLPVEKAIVTAQAQQFLEEKARAGDGLSGFPEAGFFNFVTGLPNPLREDVIFPGHLDAVNEARIARRLEESGPRFLLLVNQAAPAFGPVAFGDDYAVKVWESIERRYSLAASFGAPPDQPVGAPPFFIRVYERRE